MNKRVSLIITGKVQGVVYRYSAKEEAEKLKIGGWIKNEDDGSVRIVAEGNDLKLAEFVKWCREGSRLAKVKDIMIEWDEYKNEYSGFEIRY